MKKKTYLKNTLRDMWDTKGKVLSIFIMIFLASTVIVGLFLTGPSMRKTLNQTLKKYDHPDLTVTSTYGLDIEDQVIIEKDKDIDHVYYSKFYDGFLWENLIRVKSYSEETPKVEITEGSFPKNNDEIVIDEKLKSDFKIGDKITIKSPTDEKVDDSLENTSYKVVGFAKSSEYIFEDIRDVSISGKKMTDGFALVKEENFIKDTLGQANIFYKKTKNQDFLSDEYTDYIKEKKNSLEDSLEHREEEVLEEIKKDANEELDDSKEELDESEQELKDKEKELKDAAIALDNGYKDYEEGKKEFYNKINQGEKDLQASKIKLDQGQQQLNSAKAEYQKSVDDFNNRINEQQYQIDQGRKEIETGQKELDQAKKTYEETYEDNLAKIEKGFVGKRNELDLLEKSLTFDKEELEISKNVLENAENNLKELEASLEETDPTDPKFQEILDKIELLKSDIEKQKQGLEEKTKAYEEKSSMYEKSKEEFDTAYEEAKKPLIQAKSELDNKQAIIDQKKKELESGQKELETKKNQTLSQFANVENQIKEQEEELNNGRIQYQQGLNTLEQNRIDGQSELKSSYAELLDKTEEYEKDKKEFEEKYPDAKKEIEEGREEIEEERNKLINLEKPTYEVGYYRDNESIKTYYNNSQNIDELTKVFPTFFYFVAILVTLTTMKRYIDEQRIHVGTLKSLGYSNRDITNKFYLYGLLPTFFGSLFGSIVGKYILTKVIFDAYSTGFDILPIQYYDSLLVILATIGLSLLLIFFTIFITNRKSVNEVTANLLRGKAPKQGSRILLERLTFIWKRLTFMQKVTSRNIFRYKSRMYMTLFGVAGCTALLFFGFAMQDSIKDTSIIQRNQITSYDAIVLFDNKADEKDLDSYESEINKFDSTKIIYQQGKVESDDGKLDVNLMAFEDKDVVNDFINLRDTKKNPLEIKDSGAIITDNLAQENDLEVGDKLDFEDKDKNIKELEITGIAENYVDDYIYISKEEYGKVFDKNNDFNADLIVTDDEDTIKELEDKNAVQNIIKPNAMYETIDVLMDNLNLVIIIITLVSSILAIVVLFNLTNINVSERMRELATTKVLGFYPKETTAYIYRETFILSIIGIFFGYGLGYIMFRYVLNVVAPEGILLAYQPHPRSFIISAMITVIISLVIMFIVHKQLKSIDMAEAMKSGE